MAEKHPNARPIGYAETYTVTGPIDIGPLPDARAAVLGVLAGATYPDGGRVLSNHDADVLTDRVVAALRRSNPTAPNGRSEQAPVDP